MAKIKKYYWLKLKEDFFRQKEIKKLRKIAGGDTYTKLNRNDKRRRVFITSMRKYDRH